jgi:hypothetical protein
VPRLASHGRHHAVKYMESFVFGQEFAAFWGDYGAIEHPEDESRDGWNAFLSQKKSEAETAGRRANEEKMAGFYVDLDGSGDAVHSPADIPAGSIDAGSADRGAGRRDVPHQGPQQDEARGTDAYDSTHEQQHRLLPISHPKNWSEASEKFRRGDYFKGTEARAGPDARRWKGGRSGVGLRGRACEITPTGRPLGP